MSTNRRPRCRATQQNEPAVSTNGEPSIHKMSHSGVHPTSGKNMGSLVRFDLRGLSSQSRLQVIMAFRRTMILKGWAKWNSQLQFAENWSVWERLPTRLSAANPKNLYTACATV